MNHCPHCREVVFSDAEKLRSTVLKPLQCPKCNGVSFAPPTFYNDIMMLPLTTPVVLVFVVTLTVAPITTLIVTVAVVVMAFVSYIARLKRPLVPVQLEKTINSQLSNFAEHWLVIRVLPIFLALATTFILWLLLGSP